MCIQQTKLISKFAPPISRAHTHTHTHTHTRARARARAPAIPVGEVEQQAEYKYLLCLTDLQISRQNRQNNKMMTTKRCTQFRATGKCREFIYLFIHD